MEIVKVRCPHCGSSEVIVLQDNLYVCKHCEQQFFIHNENEYKIEHMIEKDYCPICGKKTENRDSYRCSFCNRAHICTDDIYLYSGKGHNTYICYDCVKKKDLLCSDNACGKIAEVGCINCRKKYCADHIISMINTLVMKDEHNGSFYARWKAYYCPTCKGFLCPSCVEIKHGMFSKKLICPVCGKKVLKKDGSPRYAKGNNIVEWMHVIMKNCM